MKMLYLLAAGLLAAPLAFAQYRCVENGKTLFTDKPCTGEVAPAVPTGNSPKVIGDAGNSAYSTTNGTWRGQVQFMAKAGNAVISEAHSVGPFVIDINPQGKVTGSASESGCVLKGIAKPGVFPTITELDVTLSKCNYSGFNRQMSGRVALYTEKKYVHFSLVAYEMNKRPSGHYEIKGTLRR